MINKKYYYDQMGYEIEESVVDKKECDVKVVPADALAQKKDLVVLEEKNDNVEIVRANLEDVVEYEGYDLNEIIFIVLNAHQNISKNKYFGVGILADVLKGTVSKRIFDEKLNMVPQFGGLEKLQYEKIRAIFEWMIAEHYLLKTRGKYPVLHST